MKAFRLWTMASVLAASVFVASPFAQAQDDVTQLKQQFEELDQKIRVLQRLQEIDKEAAATKARAEAVRAKVRTVRASMILSLTSKVWLASRGCVEQPIWLLVPCR